MTILCLGIIFVLIAGGGATYLALQKDTHVTQVIIKKPYDEVWSHLSNPLEYNKLYPHWIKKTSLKTPTTFLVDDQFGKSYDVNVFLDKKNGVIDLAIGSELSRMRVFPLDTERTEVIHLAKLWNGANALIWFFHKRTTDRDFYNAKWLLECEKK